MKGKRKHSSPKTSQKKRNALTNAQWARLEAKSLRGSISSPLGKTNGVRATGVNMQASRGVSYKQPRSK